MRHILICAVAALPLLGSAAHAQAAGTYGHSDPITPGTNVQPGNGVALACTAAGNVRLIMQDGSFLDLYAQQGTAIIDHISAKGVNAAGTTATCAVSVLRSY